LDDGLIYKTDQVAGVPRFVATFDSMTSGRVQLSFNVAGMVPPADQMFVAALPSVLEGAGVIDESGTPIPADEMRERMRKEILGAGVVYGANPRTGRLELAVVGTGNGAAEMKAAITWMRRLAMSPDLRID